MTDVELPVRMACFHAQQAAENALKASLVHAAIQFRKTHDLVVLVALQPDPVRSEVDSLDLQRLQQWGGGCALPSRPSRHHSRRAASVVAIADQIVAAVGVALRANGPA